MYAPELPSDCTRVRTGGMPSRRAALQPTEPATAVPKPNILFFLADDIGPVYKPWNADSTLDAPHIADLAQQGMTFTKAYSDCALCAPSRYAALTGNHAHRSTRTLGVWGMGEESAVRDGQQTLGIMLQAQSGDAAFVIRAPCAIGLNCMNVMNRMPVDAVAVGLECASYAHLRQHSNETIFAMVDAFIEGHETMDPDGLAAMEPAFVRSNVNK